MASGRSAARRERLRERIRRAGDRGDWPRIREARREVSHRTDQGTVRHDARAIEQRGGWRPGEAHQVRPICGVDKNVRRCDVPMDNSPIVGKLKRSASSAINPAASAGAGTPPVFNCSASDAPSKYGETTQRMSPTTTASRGSASKGCWSQQGSRLPPRTGRVPHRSADLRAKSPDGWKRPGRGGGRKHDTSCPFRPDPSGPARCIRLAETRRLGLPSRRLVRSEPEAVEGAGHPAAMNPPVLPSWVLEGG